LLTVRSELEKAQELKEQREKGEINKYYAKIRKLKEKEGERNGVD